MKFLKPLVQLDLFEETVFPEPTMTAEVFYNGIECTPGVVNADDYWVSTTMFTWT